VLSRELHRKSFTPFVIYDKLVLPDKILHADSANARTKLFHDI